MVTGRPPFLGDDRIAIIGQHIKTPPVALVWHSGDCPRPLEALIMRLLSKHPLKRPDPRQAEFTATTVTPQHLIRNPDTILCYRNAVCSPIDIHVYPYRSGFSVRLAVVLRFLAEEDTVPEGIALGSLTSRMPGLTAPGPTAGAG